MRMVIAVSGKEFSGGDALAAVLAEQLGFVLVTPARLIQRATARGANRDKLTATLERPPGFLRRLSVANDVSLRVLRGALAEEIQNRSVVCCGAAVDLLPAAAPEIFRVRMEATSTWRLESAKQMSGLAGRAVRKYVEDSDGRQRRWHRYVYGWPRTNSQHKCNLTINLEEVGIEGACELVEAIISRRITQTRELSAALRDFILTTRIQAELALNPATRHLELNVEVPNGLVSLHGTVRDPDDLDTAMAVVKGVTGVRLVDASKVWLLLSAPDFPLFTDARFPNFPRLAGIRSRATAGMKLRPAFAMAAISAVAIVSLVLIEVGPRNNEIWPRRSSNSRQVFTGIVTDTACAGRRRAMQQDPECIRACAKRPGVQYALFDGSKTYVIGDQTAAEKLAAQNVIVEGRVDQKTGVLLVDSIEAR